MAGDGLPSPTNVVAGPSRFYNKKHMFHTLPAGRATLILLLMCAVVCAQTALLSSEHSHQHSAQHGCGLCHAAPMPLLPAMVSTGFVPVVVLAWISWACDLNTPHDVRLAASDSRAPA
jgi:hypothetical protein